MKSVMIVDRDKEFLERVQNQLEQKKVKVSAFRNYDLAKTEIARSKPDLVVLDVNDSSALGWQILFSTVQTGLPRVIVTSENHDESEELLALRTGAEDFVSKSASTDIIVERVIGRLTPPTHGLSPSDRITAEGGQGKLEIELSRHEAYWNSAPVELTRTEMNILHALAKHPGVVKSRSQLMDEVWEDDVYVTDRCIDSHIKRIRSRIHAHDPDFKGIETVYGFGYRLNLSLPDDRSARAHAHLHDTPVALYPNGNLPGRIPAHIGQNAA